MSKHGVSAGDIAALPARFSEPRRKACARAGKSFPIVVIQEAGLDGFWIHRVLLSQGIESHVVDAASIATSRRRRRAKTDRIDGETLLRAPLAHRRGEPRVCSMVRTPMPEDEDRRRICRERKVLIMERVQHVNRVKDCSSLRAHPGMSRCVAIDARGWKRFRLAMAVACPNISKPRFVENSIGSNCCSSRSRLWRPSGMRCSTQNKPKCRPHRRCCWVSAALGRSSLRSSGLKDSLGTSITADGSPLMRALPRRLGKAGRSITTMIQLAWLWLRHQPRLSLDYCSSDDRRRDGLSRRRPRWYRSFIFSTPLLLIRGGSPGYPYGPRKGRRRSNYKSTRQTVSVAPIRPSPLSRGLPPSPAAPFSPL